MKTLLLGLGLVLVAVSCAKEKPAPPPPPPPEPAFTTIPENLLTIGGKTFDLEKWIPVRPSPSDKCMVAWFRIDLPDGRTYVDVQDPYCGGRTCRVFDAAGRNPIEPPTCLPTPELDMHIRGRLLKDDLFVVDGDSEGVANTALVRWNSVSGGGVVLEWPNDEQTSVVVRGGDVVLTSTLDFDATEGAKRKARPEARRTWVLLGDGGLREQP